MTFNIAAVDPTESTYLTFQAHNEGCSKKFIAQQYFMDFEQICSLGSSSVIPFSQYQQLRARYMMLVDCLFDEGDVQLIELRGWVDGAACAIGTDPANFEWLHDAFEWVLA